MPLRPPVVRPPWPEPDAAQARAIGHRDGALLVRGAAGTGKTLTALRVVADRVERGELELDDVLLLAATRRAAARLRDELSAHLRRTTGAPVVRTASSAAFAILRARATLLGRPSPTLISGPEQDLVLADLLAGHLAGEGAPLRWPATVPDAAVGLRAFRDELRDLLMRAAERGLEPADLARLGRRQDRPEWVAAATVYAEYLDVTRLRTGTPDAGARYDPAVIVDEAAEALGAWDEVLPGAPRPGWRLVVVDDHQESTAAGARLLHALVAGGAELVLLADPDAAVQTFRGASPALVDRAGVAPSGSELGAFAADEVTLDRVWRHGPTLRGAVGSVTGVIRGPGRAHRRAGAVERSGSAQVALLRSSAQEAAYVAYLLRSAHLYDRVPWDRMAVVVRSGGQVAALRRSLLDAGVPVAVTGSDLPLRSEPAVRPLLLALGRAHAVTADDAAHLLVSPLGGMDAVGLRRLRRALRAEELAGGGERSSDELLVEAVAEPGRTATLPATVRRGPQRLARVLAATRDAAAEPGASALDVLWALWSSADLAPAWQQTALTGGPAGARADADLDAVLALFTAAEQFIDRLPQASLEAFVEHVRSQDLPADTLAARGDTLAVELLTAAGAAGGEWDLVVVAGVQEGVWPDLRLRDHLLGAGHLVDVLAGRVAGRAGGERTGGEGTESEGTGGERFVQARAAVLDDELRSFAVAVSRARDRLVVTAVRDGEQRPSPFVDLIVPTSEDGPDERMVAVPAALDLRAVVAQARARLEQDAAVGEARAQLQQDAAVGEARAQLQQDAAAGEARADPIPDAGHPAARLLARLAVAGVPGADPSGWYGLGGPSTMDPLWPPDALIPLSPSRLETAVTCALRWALETAGGRGDDSTEQSLGTLVHEVAATMPHGTQPELAEAVDARWDGLELPDGWVGARERRRADAMVGHLAAYLRSAPEVVAVEQRFAVEVGRVELRGSVDRLERVVADDGTERVRVIDLKTGRSQVAKEAARRNPQLGAYQVAVEAGAFDEVTGGARSAGAALVYVGTSNTTFSRRDQPALPDDADPGWAHALLDEVADVVSRSAVAACANDLCRVCPVTRSCPLQPEGKVVGS